MNPFQRADLRRVRSRGVNEADFTGRWRERHPWSVPGPFYATTFNTLSLAALANDKPGLILFDSRGEFIWRQPMSPIERDALLEAMSNDEAMSYQIDGDAHWTPDLLSEWFRTQAPELRRWASEASTEAYLEGKSSGLLSRAVVRKRLSDLIHYFDTRLGRDIAEYGRALGANR